MTDETQTQTPQTTTPLTADGEAISDYDKALALVERREAATKAEKEVLEEKKKLAANSMIGGTTGGNVVTKLVSPEDKKINDAKEFFKGTGLGDAIAKANE